MKAMVKHIARIAKEYDIDVDYLRSIAEDMESDGIKVTPVLLRDMLDNGDI